MKLHFEHFGTGDPLLILHGFLGMSDNWHSLGKRFAEDYSVIIPDLRNHGRSPHSDDFGMELMVKDIIDLLNDEHIGKVNVIGHSMGGRIVMWLAINHPELLKKCIVVDIGPGLLPRDLLIGTILDIMNHVDLDQYKSLSEIELKLSESIEQKQIVQFVLKNIKRDINRNSFTWKPNVKVLQENAWKISVPLKINHIVKTEMLFIKGEFSKYIDQNHPEEIYNYFPNAKLIEIKNSGHWVHADNPQAFYEESTRFLNGSH
jgi:esterase